MMGRETAAPRFAERSIAIVSRRLRVALGGASRAECVTPVVSRLNQVMVSSRIGPQSTPSERSPGG